MGGNNLADGEVPSQETGAKIVGKRALLTGLVRMPEFNGEWGKIESYDSGLQRYVVRVVRDSGLVFRAKLRRDNLVIPATVALRFAEDDRGMQPPDDRPTSSGRTAFEWGRPFVSKHIGVSGPTGHSSTEMISCAKPQRAVKS